MLRNRADWLEKGVAALLREPNAGLVGGRIQVFFKNPEKAGFQISPDGNYMSYRAPWKSRMNIFV